jgi:hypothetical protein
MGNLVPTRLAIVDPTQYLAMDPSAPPMAIRKYFCMTMPFWRSHVPERTNSPGIRDAREFLNFDQGTGRDTTPQQDSLSGVIICPAYRKGQRLRANSFATSHSSIKNQSASKVKANTSPTMF